MAQTEHPEIIPVDSVIEILAGVGVVLMAVLVVFLVTAMFQPVT